jgi:TrmH family RNA methyltransferase
MVVTTSVPEAIRSLQNPKVKLWASLQERKYREREGLFVVEGVHLVQEALLSGAAVDQVAYGLERGLPDELVSLAENRPERFVPVSEEVLRKCTGTVTPQGVFAVVQKPRYSAEDILARHRSLVIAVDRLQDPGNLGTIIRSADAAGASAVLLGKGTVDLYNPKTIRSTMGSLFHLPVAECDLSAWLPRAREAGVRVYAARLEEATDCYDLDLTHDTWFVIGNEGSGVLPEVQQAADNFVRIPMPGRSESLNAAMAATVLLFEAVRQRRATGTRMPT